MYRGWPSPNSPLDYDVEFKNSELAIVGDLPFCFALQASKLRSGSDDN
jgi:hypothetical protein